jgi:hypothetical protein
MYFYWLNSFLSAQNKFSPIVLFNDDAFIRASYHEAELYYPLKRDIIVSIYTGLEIIKGNKNTDTTTVLNGNDGVSGLPRNQRGEALGIGLDLALSSQTTLFFRHRWFSFDDKNFVEERFNGHESTLELKIFF